MVLIAHLAEALRLLLLFYEWRLDIISRGNVIGFHIFICHHLFIISAKLFQLISSA
jgi:hypothetical protein